MKKTLHLCLALVGILLLQSCNQKATPAANDYFAQSKDSVQTGGIKMIPITTPKATATASIQSGKSTGTISGTNIPVTR